MSLAKEMIYAAKQCGADAVKVQNYRTEDFLLGNEADFAMFKKHELDMDRLRLLKEYADSLGILFHSTPTSGQGVLDLVDLGVTVFKNGSDFLGHHELIRIMAKTGGTVVLSTGMANDLEVKAAVNAFLTAGENRKLVVLHCTSLYPTPLEQSNIHRMLRLRSDDYLIGFSDHTEGVAASLLAVAYGACWIEKHFTLSKSLEGPDHRFSAEPAELSNLVSLIRQMEVCMRSFGSPDEKRDYRVSILAARDMPVGHVIGKADIRIARPGGGIEPHFAASLMGMRLTRAVVQGQVLTWSVL
jgi:N-acetylneuraminate synthase/N,N'-diacetyllegionaminate synthase